ncbi:AI-2E family transporter [Desulfonema magnum]|uniref:Transmembrane protein, TqsA-like n=1 Tax=Desulfonema magnum TaxID=45655 RepID=A0A975BTD1_9BACT|nr:AI-2E family transporter [Desulfonema magnum]QTA91414.1 Transmembrane protein, TqsA-like [Desulfonema magnum]
MLKLFRSWLNQYFADPQVIILGFLLSLGFVLIFIMGDMLAPVFISVVIAYLLEGMVSRLQRFRMPRLAAVIVVFLCFMACIVVMIIGLLPLLSEQIGDLVQKLPSMIEKGQKLVMNLPERYPGFISRQELEEIVNSLSSELTGLVKSKLTKVVQGIFSFSLASVKSIITFLVYSILVPLMIFFFLKDKKDILEWVAGFLPKDRGLATEVWNEVNKQTGNYVRGKIWEILIVWGVTYFTFRLFELDFTMLLSLFVGLSVIVPYIGATVMFLPVALVAYFQWGWGADFAYIMVALGIIQALDGNLLVPLLFSGAVNLHPVAIIIAILVFGGLWGLWGLFFAIPLASLSHAVVKAWLTKEQIIPTED